MPAPRTYKSGLLGLTAAAALMAVPALAQNRDGTPGNPPSTATQRAADSVTGNRTPPDGTPGNPPGTALGRAADRAGQNAADANARNGDPANTQNRPDGTPGNPPGTAVTRAIDRAAGTNMSGAFPQNSDGTPGNPPGTVVGRAVDRAATDSNDNRPNDNRSSDNRRNEPPAVNANPSAMGSTQAQQGQTGMPGAVNRTPDGDQARAGTANVPLQNQAAGSAPANPSGPDGGRGASAPNTAASSTANAPAAQTERASRIIGSTVYNERNESVGTVDDIILAQGGSSPMAIVSVGGFLGIGAKLVAVPMSGLRWSAADNRWTITGATRDSLTSLPAYSYDNARRG
jgi:hypothetical protein